jgi:hypothetical protein
MITYKLASYRPPSYRPPAKLGQEGAVRATVVGAGLVLTALAAGTTWVGLNAGINGKGFIRVVGWVTGIAAGLATLTHLAGVVGIAVLPLPKSSSPAPDVYTSA